MQNFGNIMKQAKKLQERMAQLQDQLALKTVEASAGGGMRGDFTGSKSAQDIEDVARYRLVIEEGPQAGSFIYKTLDRRTGEVVSQFPREDILRLRNAEDYSPGKVFDGQS